MKESIFWPVLVLLGVIAGAMWGHGLGKHYADRWYAQHPCARLSDVINPDAVHIFTDEQGIQWEMQTVTENHPCMTLAIKNADCKNQLSWKHKTQKSGSVECSTTPRVGDYAYAEITDLNEYDVLVSTIALKDRVAQFETITCTSFGRISGTDRADAYLPGEPTQ